MLAGQRLLWRLGAPEGARPGAARWLLGLGIAATLAANVGHGLGRGWSGAAVAAWPATALVGSYELLMMIIRGAQTTDDSVAQDGEHDPLHEQAAELFADEIAAARIPLQPCHPRLSVSASLRRSACATISPKMSRGTEKTSLPSWRTPGTSKLTGYRTAFVGPDHRGGSAD